MQRPRLMPRLRRHRAGAQRIDRRAIGVELGEDLG
jgi:hypothetical protein